VSDATGVVVLMGRILFAFYFGAVAGHFKRDQMMRGYATAGGVPGPGRRGVGRRAVARPRSRIRGPRDLA
jgi:hypothetical protein